MLAKLKFSAAALSAASARSAYTLLATRAISMHPAPRMKGKTAIVTGSGSGIGRGIAEKFAEHGANVVIADLNLAAAQAVAKTLPNAIAVQVDVSQEDAVKACVKATIDKFGAVDVLVSNAGFQHIDPVESFPTDIFRKMLDVHVTGTFIFTKHVLNEMYKRDTKGKILIMGSVHSKEASPVKSAYVAAKHALLGFTRAVAKEAGPKGVACNLICPGFVLTPLVQKQIPEQAKNLGLTEEQVVKNVMLKNTVDGEFSTVDDIAESALFFAAHPTNALTGQSLNISHGWHMD